MTSDEKERMLKEAAQWVGYREKQKCDYSFYDVMAGGAGLNNFTRFGRLADIVLYGADRRVKDGYPWCAMFLLAVLYELKAGRQDCTVGKGQMPVDEAARQWVREVVGLGADIPWHAGCNAWLKAFRHNYRSGKVPHPGDFVVYLDSCGRAYHIGLVESVHDGGQRFVTIEGNTSAAGDNVVANGGAVARKIRKNQKCEFLYC